MAALWLQYPHTTKADEQQLKKETDKLQRLFLKIRLEDKRLLRSPTHPRPSAPS